MECKIWDKTSSINGVDASIVLKSRPWAETEDVILICEGDKVNYIERPSILRESLNLESTLSSLEIGTAYIDFLTEQAKAAVEEAKNQQTTMESLQSQIDDINLMIADLMVGGVE